MYKIRVFRQIFCTGNKMNSKVLNVNTLPNNPDIQQCCELPALSPFPKIKAFSSKVLSHDCVVTIAIFNHLQEKAM